MNVRTICAALSLAIATRIGAQQTGLPTSMLTPQKLSDVEHETVTVLFKGISLQPSQDSAARLIVRGAFVDRVRLMQNVPTSQLSRALMNSTQQRNDRLRNLLTSEMMRARFDSNSRSSKFIISSVLPPPR